MTRQYLYAECSPQGVTSRDPRWRSYPQISKLENYLRALVVLDEGDAVRFLWGHGIAGSLIVDVAAPNAANVRDVAVSAATPQDLFNLTTRELQVLTLLACGLSNLEISEALEVSRRTISTHVERLLPKLNVATRAAAATLATEHGLLRLPFPLADTVDLPSIAVVRIHREAARAQFSSSPPQRRRAAARAITIGGIYPDNPVFRDDAQDMRMAAQLATDTINARGGIGGHQVRLIETKADATSASSLSDALRTLVDLGVDAVSSSYVLTRSPGALAQLFQIASEWGAPFFHHSTSRIASALVADDPHAYGNIFQACTGEDAYGAGFIRTLNELRMSGQWAPTSRRLLVFDTTDPFLTTFSAATHDAAHEQGWNVEVVGVDAVSPDPAIVNRAIERVDPAAVMIACFSAAGTADLLQQISSVSTRPEMLRYCLYAPSVPGFLDRVGLAAEGILWATVTGVYSDARGTRFAQHFRREYGRSAGISSAGIHFDVINILAQTWSQVSSSWNFTAVRSHLREAVFRGVNGSYYFGSAGQTNGVYPDRTLDASIAPAHLIFQVQHGQHRIIAPRTFATSQYRRLSAI